MEIDTNIAERTIPPLASIRKNVLFVGLVRRVKHWAVIASFVETCKSVGAKPKAYLNDVITGIAMCHPQLYIGDLLLWAYQAMCALKAVA